MLIKEHFSELELKALVDAVLRQAQQTRQRRAIVIAGDVDWCRHTVKQTMAHSKLSRVSGLSSVEFRGIDVLPMSAAKTLLGQERDAIIFDAHSGFDADALGVVSGVICGGGLLFLLCPPLKQWEHFADPAAQRIAVWPHDFANVSGRFLRRFARIISASSAVTLLEQNSVLPFLSTPTKSQILSEEAHDIFRTEDQHAAVIAIEQLANGPTDCPMVLVADRGRGKTSALGIAAARLLTLKKMSIVVTAPRPAAVQTLFEQAKKLLPGARVRNNVRNNSVQWNDGSIQFVAPDVLCLSEVSADLLLVDEAAAIPATLLQQFLTRYSRLVFSTTTHGYEGTGRGFAVRFKQTLNEQTPGWREVNLHTPIRWAENDPLERLVFDTLLLDANSADDESVVLASVKNVTIEKINRDDLSNDDILLSQIFGLLVTAHYRTSPNDLRNLLDGPGLSVFVSRYHGQVVATALVTAEGGFDAAITDEIYAGKRRPRGHLLPQSLTAHAGLKEAASLRCARVMRIAVHPAVQRKGLGRQLLQHIKCNAMQQGVDLFGASFGATEALLHFWQREKIFSVRLGFRRGHASGEYSVLMLAGLSAAGEKVYAAARRRFQRDLPQWLADPLQTLDATVVTVLQQDIDDNIDAGTAAALPESHDREMLISFACGERTYEDALAPIWRLLVEVEQQTNFSVSFEYDLLRIKVLQKKSWAAVAEQFNLAGKSETLTHLREGVGQLLGSPAISI